MADNSNDSTMQNQDVIQAARGIRSNPALFAALMSPPTAAPASADPTAGLSTHNDPGGQFGGPRASRQSAPQSSRALATAMASVPTPMPPIRPTDLDAITALASPPPGANDPSIAARAAEAGAPAGWEAKASSIPTTSLIATPPSSVFADDPGAAQRASLYRQLNPTGSPIGTPPRATVNPPPQSAPSPQTGWQSAPVVPVGGKPNFFDDLIPQRTGWQPPDAPQPAKGGNFFDDLIPQAKGGYGRDPVVGVPTDERPAMVDEYGNPTMANLKAIPGAIDDAVRNAANGMTLGYGDKIAAFMDAHNPWGSGDYDSNLANERAQSQAAMDRAGPIAGNVEQMAGTLLPGGAIAKGVGAAVKGVPLIGSALGRGALTGAAIGGGTAAGNEQDVGQGALYGAGAGAAGSIIGSIVGGLGKDAADLTVNRPGELPAASDVRAEARGLYRDPALANTTVTPDAVSRLADNIDQIKQDQVYRASTHPGSQAIFDELDALKTNPNPSLNDLNVLNKVAGNVASAGKGGPDTALGSAVRGAFSDYVTGLGQDDLASGNAGATAGLARAQQLWAQQAKLGRVEGALESASDRAHASGSGANIDNATRQRLVALKKQNGWTPDEQDAIQSVIDGTSTGNTARWVGKLLGGHGGIGGFGAGAVGALEGFEHGGVPGAAVGASLPIVGFGAKKLSDGLTASRVAQLRATIAAGGRAPMTYNPAPGTSAVTNALARAAAAQAAQQNGPQ
jgi:hypothetical protein